jgi:hypothetical protein
MKKMLLAMVVGFGFQGVAQAGIVERCNELRQGIKEAGIPVRIELEAIELLNATQRHTHMLDVVLVPSVYDSCVAAGGPNDASSALFSIGKDVELRTSFGTFSAAWAADYPHVVVNDSGVALNGYKLTAYHAVFAVIMRNLGYETFESAEGDAFPTLLDPAYLNLGTNTQISTLVGVGSVGGRLYQIMVQRVTVGGAR